jgi:tetratricopeptide (TPR) repeat protein
MRRQRLLMAALAATSPALVSEFVRAAPLAATERYTFTGVAFAEFVRDSYRESGRTVEPFDPWLQNAYAQNPKAWLGKVATMSAALESRKLEITAQRNPAARARLERKTAAWLHRLVKVLIPKFSLERGFEFVNTVSFGERQCLLQSVLIAGLAQEMGIQGGAAMVWRNQNGITSNLGHMVTVFKLADGRDVLVDASDPEPFMRHQGLFMTDSSVHDLRFLEPIYDADANIIAYKRSLDAVRLTPAQVRPLNHDFLRGQFYYYRGERAPRGFFGPSTPEGLAASARLLEQAIRIDSRNPLAVYVLGLVYRKQGRTVEARAQLQKGFALYERYGFVPDGPREAIQP